MSDTGHLYVPNLAVIDRVVEETWDTKTFRAVFADGPTREVLSQTELLNHAALHSPEVTALGMRLGFPCLKAEEFSRLSRPGGM